MIDIKALTDYQIFDIYFHKATAIEKISIEHQLFKRYKPLVYKMKKNFNLRLQKIPYVSYELKDYLINYENDIYYRFKMAINSVKWYKIPNSSWTFYYSFWGYLITYNRDVINNFIKNNNTVSYEEIISSDEASYKKDLASIEINSSVNVEEEFLKKEEQNHLKKVIEKSIKKFSPMQLNIWNIRLNNLNIKVDNICKLCNISKKEYKSAIEGIKKIISFEKRKI